MKVILILGLIALFIYLIYLLVHHIRSTNKLKVCFNKGNVIVFGKKGKGKDLLFQFVINKRRKPYFSNISFGGKYHKASFEMLNLGNNTYENFIDGDVEIIKKSIKPFEDKDFYFSDAGIHIPSQYDSYLHKKYKGLPISYALSRHLWNNNIHTNAQNLERIWKALREQADTYIRVKNTERTLIPGVLRINFTIYDKYQSAVNNLCPVSNRVWNKYSKAEKDLFIANNGLVEDRFIFIHKSKIYYDTRAYHKIIFGKKFKKK